MNRLGRILRELLSRLCFESKLNLGIFAIVAGMAFLLLPVVAQMTSSALVEENKKRGIAMARSLALRAVEPLLARDYLHLHNMMEEGGDLIYTFVLDAHGHVVTHSFEHGFPVELLSANAADTLGAVHVQLVDTGKVRIYDFAAPIQVAREQIGTVRLGLSRSRISGVIRQLISAIAILFGTALFVATAFGSVFARTVTRRLARLREHAEKMVVNECVSISDLSDQSKERQPTHGFSWAQADVCCLPRRSEMQFCQEACDSSTSARRSRGDEIHDLTVSFDFMASSLREHILGLREAKQNLLRQQGVLSTVLDMNPDRIAMLDTRMIYQIANRAFAKSVGKSVESIEGLNDFHLFPEEEAERRNLEGREVLMTGRRVDRQERVEGPKEQRWFQVVQIPVHDETGRISGLLRMDRDITDSKEYEQRLIQAQKMESVGKLAGGIAHEINTPLGIILGYAQLLQDDVPSGGQVCADLQIIEKQAQVCRKIVADLLGFSRQTESDKREMCFNNSIMESVTLVRHAFSLDHVRILTRLDDRYPIIYGDPEKLKQVWLNLLNNAKDALPAGGGTIVVSTELKTPQGVVSVKVGDDGTGVEPLVLKKIFDPFFTTKPVDQGTGLGLSVSFGIIQDHMGEIQVQSPLPSDFFPDLVTVGSTRSGTLFSVDVPLDHCSDT